MCINLFFRRLFASWKVLLISITVSLGIATAFLILSPKQWEATASIRMASFNGINVQTAPTTIAIIRSTGVIAAVLEQLKLPVNDSMVRNIHQWMRTRIIDNDNLELSIRLNDRQFAINIANGIFSWIKQEQDQMIDSKMESLRKRNDILQTIKDQNMPRGNNPEQQSRELYTIFLLNEIGKMEFNLWPLYDNKHTELITPIYSSHSQVFPIPSLILSIAAMIGTVTGIIWIFGCGNNED